VLNALFFCWCWAIKKTLEKSLSVTFLFLPKNKNKAAKGDFIFRNTLFWMSLNGAKDFGSLGKKELLSFSQKKGPLSSQAVFSTS